MKAWAMTISAVALAFSPSGCSSNHVIATKDGRMILTEGKPEMDDASCLVRYRDSQGNDMQINRNDISQIITR